MSSFRLRHLQATQRSFSYKTYEILSNKRQRLYLLQLDGRQLTRTIVEP